MTPAFMPAFHSDVLWRPVKFVRAKAEQQALLAIYTDPPPYESPTATALGSGESFAAHTGASGIGYTVFTNGLVCFGKPRDGPSCFLAAPSYRVIAPQTTFVGIQRGAINEDGELQFSDVGGGTGLLALTFAGQAFHACYLEGDFSTRVATSFDGVTWNEQAGVFPSTDYGGPGGAVAFNGDPDDPDSGNYAMAGNTQVAVPEDTDPPWAGAIENLAWATAAAPPPPPEEGEPPTPSLSWSYGSNESVEEDPGAIMARNGVQNQQGTVAGGNGVFAAATCGKEIVTVGEGEPGAWQQVVYTAAIASSSDGSGWANNVLGGVQEGSMIPGEEGESRTIAVVFVKALKPEDSFFVCAAYNFSAVEDRTWATVHKSSDGTGWSPIRTMEGFPGALSVIAADLNNTTIIHL